MYLSEDDNLFLGIRSSKKYEVSVNQNKKQTKENRTGHRLKMNISNFLTIVHLSTLFKTGDLISWPWFISFLIQITVLFFLTDIFTCMELVCFFF